MAFSKAKDKFKSVGSSDISTAVIKATSHTQKEIPKEKYVKSNFCFMNFFP